MTSRSKKEPLWVAMMSLTLLLVNVVRCYQHEFTRDEDILLEAKEAISSILVKPWLPDCSLVYVTDDTTPNPTSLHQLFRALGIESSVGIFRLYQRDEYNSTLLYPLDFIDNIKQIRKSSRCVTMMITSKDLEFLSIFVEDVINDALLVWPNRLLIVTRCSTQQIRSLQKPLSALNAIVLVLDDNLHPTKYSVYTFMPYSQRMILEGNWAPTRGITYFTENSFFYDKFRKLKEGAELLLIGQNLPPHLIVRKRISEETGEEKLNYSGPIMMVLNILANHVNFTYKIIPPFDGKWGYLLPNGTWDGMIGMLVRKQADFAISPLAVTYLRSQAIDFTNTLYVDSGRILGRRGNTEINPWSFVLPLTASVWSAILGTSVVIVVLVMFLSEIEWNTSSLSPKISVATYIRTFFQQDINVYTENTWEKFLLGVWMLGVLVVFKSYSTNLTSLLAVRYISEPYQSLKDMVSDPGVTSIWFQNTAYIQYLRVVKSGIFYEVAEMGKQGRIKQIQPQQYATIVNNLVSRGDHVMMNPLLMMKMFLTEDYMENGNCKFYVSKDTFLPFTFGLILQKHSPLMGAINQGIRAVVEGGLYDYWLDKSFVNAKSCKNPPTTITVKSQLSLMNTWGMFVVLLVGYIISLSAFILERATFSLSEMRSSPNRLRT